MIEQPGRRIASLTPYSIGDPGRAASEVPPGPPTGFAGNSDVEISAAALAGLQIRAASVRGVRQRACRLCRQGAFALASRDPGEAGERAIAVTCGGVGGHGHSQEAAVLVSRQVAGLAATGASIPDAIAVASRTASGHLAATLLAGRDGECTQAGGMATTVAGLMVYRDGAHWIGEAGVAGDCWVWHLSPAGQWTVLAGPQPDNQAGETPDNRADETPALPLPSVHGRCTSTEFLVTDGALFVMTGGVADPLRSSRQVQVTLANWWRSPPDPFTFAAQAGFARKSHQDDRTVIGIWADDADQARPARQARQ